MDEIVQCLAKTSHRFDFTKKVVIAHVWQCSAPKERGEAEHTESQGYSTHQQANSKMTMPGFVGLKLWRADFS